MNRDASPADERVQRFCSPASVRKAVQSAAAPETGSNLTSPADSHSNSERGSPDPLQSRNSEDGVSPATAQVTSIPAGEIEDFFGTCDSNMNGRTAVATNNMSGIGDDPDESFDMLANMPPTPGDFRAPSGGGDGGFGDSEHDAEGSFSDLLGIQDSCPTTPAAVSQQVVRRSSRKASSSGNGIASRSLFSGIGVKGGRNDVTGGGANSGGVTPYGSRRSERRANGQALPERAFTPGLVRGDDDDANASFCTAIMGSVDGGTDDPDSGKKGASLFSGERGDEGSMAGDFEPKTPVDMGGAAYDISMTPSFDLSLSSVEKHVADLKLTGDAVDAARTFPAASNAPCIERNHDDQMDFGLDTDVAHAGMDDVAAPVGRSTLSPVSSQKANVGAFLSAAVADGDGGISAVEVKQWLEPPSPAMAPPSSTATGGAGGDHRATFSLEETAAVASSAEVSPYGPRGRLGGGLSTGSTYGPSSDDQEDFMTAAFAAGAGVGGVVTEMTLPTLPRVEETIPEHELSPPPPSAAANVATAAAPPAPPAAADVAPGTEGDRSDVAGGKSNMEVESSVILDEVLQTADGLGGAGRTMRKGRRGGAGPALRSIAVASPAGKGKGVAVVLSAVEKEAMALAAACVAEQEALSKTPEVGEEAAIQAGTETSITVVPAVGVECDGGDEQPEIAGEESGGRNGDAFSFSKGKAGSTRFRSKPAAPGKPAAPIPSGKDSVSDKDAKLGGTGMKGSRVSISRVAAPAAASARRGGSNNSSRRGSIRPPSPSRISIRAPSPSSSGVRPPSPARSGLRPPSPSTAQRRPSMTLGSRVAFSDVAGGAPVAAKPVAIKTLAANPEATKPAATKTVAATESVDQKAAPAAAAVAKRASSRGRDRGAQGRPSTANSTGAAPAAAPAALVVTVVDPTSRLLAPTKVSQGRARPRSASPAVSLARGRASVGGFGGPGGPGPGVNRRMSVAGPTPLQQQQQKQQQQQEEEKQAQPRSASTGRRALTMPKAPNFRTSSRAKGDKEMKTSEEIEFRKQQAMQDELKQMTRKNQVAMERSRRTAYSGNVRSSKPLTVPESPAMKTVVRLGGKVYAAVGPQDHAGYSPTHPAKHDSLSKDAVENRSSQPKGPTVPAPFQLSKSNRVSRDGGSAPGTPRSKEETMTFRESMARIENKTPDRFRTRPAGEQPKPAPVPRVEVKPTLPQSPKFRTEARAAAHTKTHVMSRDEREEAELAEMKKHQFKARPYSADGFGVGGEQGVFRPQHSDKKLTQPTPFHLSSEDRASKRAPSPHRSRDEEELSKQFKARPLPSGRSSSVGRVRPGANVGAELKPRELTVAASPKLSTKRRSALRSSSVGGGGVGGTRTLSSEEAELEKAAANKFRARPMPDYSKPDQSRRHSVAPTEPPAALTEPQPFNLRSDARGKAKRALLAQRMLDQRRQEEAAARVRARPLPALSNGFFPQPSDRPLTETSEFCLSSQARHEKAVKEFRDRVRMEEERARRATEVIALPLPAATFEPELYPERTEISLTQPVEITMHSSARAEGRAKWDEKNQARLAEEERVRRERAEAVAASEKRAIAELRRRSHDAGGMAFKAKPITWNSAPPEVAQLSTAPLTTPITPNLRTKRRAANAAIREPPAPMA